MTLSPPYALLAGIALLVAFVLVDARRNLILFVMGYRNILRRKGTTLLVISGLMVGGAIISASFVIGDTLDNMIIGETTKGSGGADFVVAAPGELGNAFFDDELAVSLEADLERIDEVSAARSFIDAPVGVLDVQTQLTDAASGLMGITPDVLSSYQLNEVDGDRVSAVPSRGEAYINEKLATELDARVGDTLTLLSGEDSMNVTVTRVVAYEQLGSYALEPHVYIDLGTAQELVNRTAQRNIMFISLVDPGGLDAGKAREDINATLKAYSSDGLVIVEDKQKSIEQGLDDMSTYTSLFFLLGSFSVIAGVALIANIFTMLGEERKGEIGISRAIGMRRAQLVRVFTYEGMLYAAMAAGVGTLAGLALAYVIIHTTTDLFYMGDFPIAPYFYFTPFSLAVSYVIGFLLTIAVVFVITRRISRLNIVRAFRNIPEPPLARADRRTWIAGAVLFFGGVAFILAGIVTESRLLAMGGLSTACMSLGLLLRRVLGDRAAWSIASVATLTIWLPLPFQLFPYEGFIELFVLAGIFMVSAALILVMVNSNVIIWLFTRLLWARGAYRAVVRTAISYPLRSKFRTALSIFIFGLVIFTVTTLSVISGIIDVGIPKMAAETSGDYDIIAYTNPSTPIEGGLWERTNTSATYLQGDNITNVVPMQTGAGLISVVGSGGVASGNQTLYTVLGFDNRLFTEGQYWFADWDRSRFSSELEVWQGVLDNTDLVIVDGSMLNNQLTEFVPGPRAAIGDTIVLTTVGGTHSFEVVGIMKQPVLTGIFVSNHFTSEGMNITNPGVYMINVQNGLDVEHQAALLEREFLANGMQTIPVATVADEFVDQIEGVLSLFRAFLGLGLIIGISGLGIITMRSVRERRLEIGMMRAIGFTKRMVVANFALESAFVSVLGIILGSLLGISVGYTVYLEAFQELGYDFIIPWGQIAAVGVLAFMATLLSVYPAARGASRVSPAEVLRFE